MKIKKILSISLVKTIHINLHYFGLKGFLCPIIVFRNIELAELKGQVIIDKWQTGVVRIGELLVGSAGKKESHGVWQVSGTIWFKGKCVLGSGSKLSCNKNGKIIFGDNFATTANSEFICSNKMVFGANSLISWDCLFMDNDLHKIHLKNNNKQINESAEIVIGEFCWICCRSVILKGVHLANNTIVAANSTITSSFSEENIIVGACNKVLKKEVCWERPTEYNPMC